METAIIDNNDSFTYNLVELIRRIPGHNPTVLPSDRINLQELEKYDSLILSPGPGLPHEFPVLRNILKIFKESKPILGVCLGHQAIADYFGARLVNLPSVIHGQPREINIVRVSALYKNIPQNFNAGLYHSWVVDTKSFPKELEITGLSSDGNIMSFQHKRYSLFGVQFHPESIMTEYGLTLIQNFLGSGLP